MTGRRTLDRNLVTGMTFRLYQQRVIFLPSTRREIYYIKKKKKCFPLHNVNSNKVKRVREQTTRQYSDYKKDAVPSITGDKYELEGYSSDNDKTSFYRSIENGEESGDEGFLFVS